MFSSLWILSFMTLYLSTLFVFTFLFYANSECGMWRCKIYVLSDFTFLWDFCFVLLADTHIQRIVNASCITIMKWEMCCEERSLWIIGLKARKFKNRPTGTVAASMKVGVVFGLFVFTLYSLPFETSATQLLNNHTETWMASLSLACY